MRILLTTTAFLTLVLSMSHAETPTVSSSAKAFGSDEQTLNAIEHGWCDAFLKGDADYIDSVIDASYVQTNVRGEVTSKSQELEELRRGDIAYERFETSDLKIKVYDNAAVVVGQTFIKGRLKATGREINATIRFTDTFVKRGGVWKIVASQTTLPPNKAGT